MRSAVMSGTLIAIQHAGHLDTAMQTASPQGALSNLCGAEAVARVLGSLSGGSIKRRSTRGRAGRGRRVPAAKSKSLQASIIRAVIHHSMRHLERFGRGQMKSTNTHRAYALPHLTSSRMTG